MFGRISLVGLWLAASALMAQSAARVELGKSPTGATAAFIQNASGGWGMEIAGSSAPRITQLKPAKVEICLSETNIRQLAVAYDSVRKLGAGVDARAVIADGGHVLFRLDDQ